MDAYIYRVQVDFNNDPGFCNHVDSWLGCLVEVQAYDVRLLFGLPFLNLRKIDSVIT